MDNKQFSPEEHHIIPALYLKDFKLFMVSHTIPQHNPMVISILILEGPLTPALLTEERLQSYLEEHLQEQS